MKTHLLFVGNKFMHNEPLKQYVLRHVGKAVERIEQIHFVQDSDNTLFLTLEMLFKEEIRLIIVATRQSSAIIGKLLCTITMDNQVLKEQMLIPSRATLFEQGSYLLEHDKAQANVLIAHENESLPPLLFETAERSGILHVFGESSASLRSLLDPIAQSSDIRFDLTTVVDGWITVYIQSRRYGNIAQFLSSAKQLMPHKVIATSNLIGYIIERLSKQGKKLTFAESCTGGLLAYHFTAHGGASAVFEGALVTYSNALKSNWLAVDETALEMHGAVSAEVVREMSEGALSVTYADFALAVSGVAGPDGGSALKPVGTVFICARSKTHHHVEQLHLSGDRNYIQEQSALYAIKMLLQLDKELFF
ncbi:MAG: CinA family protein [Campylobacterales bacterium]|nr:CinA family protein [Campylobacterales bacterium]